MRNLTMNIYSRKIIAVIAVLCAAAAITTACRKNKTEEPSASSSSVAEVLEEVTTESETEEKTTAPKETEAETEVTTAQTTAQAVTEAATTPVTETPAEIPTETPSTGEPEIEIATVPVPNEPVIVAPTEPVVVNPDTPAIPNYDEDIKEKLGIEVTLSGTNEQQAQQYVDACKAAYPSLPWYCTGTSAGVDVSTLTTESPIDIWSMTEEEVDALINERLAGRDYKDLSLEELYYLQELTGPTAFGCEIFDYFNALTHKDFNSGGITVW